MHVLSFMRVHLERGNYFFWVQPKSRKYGWLVSWVAFISPLHSSHRWSDERLIRLVDHDPLCMFRDSRVFFWHRSVEASELRRHQSHFVTCFHPENEGKTISEKYGKFDSKGNASSTILHSKHSRNLFQREKSTLIWKALNSE